MKVKPITIEEKKALELWERGEFTTIFSLLEETKPTNPIDYLKIVDPKLEYVKEEKSLYPQKLIEEIAEELFRKRVYEIIRKRLEGETWERKGEIREEVKRIFDKLGVKYEIGQITDIYGMYLDTKEVVLVLDNVKIEPYKSVKETIFPSTYFVGDGWIFWSPNVGVKHINLILGLCIDNQQIIGLGYGEVEKVFYLRWYKDTGWEPIEWGNP